MSSLKYSPTNANALERQSSQQWVDALTFTEPPPPPPPLPNHSNHHHQTRQRNLPAISTTTKNSQFSMLLKPNARDSQPHQRRTIATTTAQGVRTDRNVPPNDLSAHDAPAAAAPAAAAPAAAALATPATMMMIRTPHCAISAPQQTHLEAATQPTNRQAANTSTSVLAPILNQYHRDYHPTQQQPQQQLPPARISAPIFPQASAPNDISYNHGNDNTVQHLSPISSSVVLQQQQQQQQELPSSSHTWKIPPPPSDPPPNNQHRCRRSPPRRQPPPTTATTTTTTPAKVDPIPPAQQQQQDDTELLFDPDDQTPTNSVQGSLNSNSKKEDDGISLTPIKGNRSFLGEPLNHPSLSNATSGSSSLLFLQQPQQLHAESSSYLPRNYSTTAPNATTTTQLPRQHPTNTFGTETTFDRSGVTTTTQNHNKPSASLLKMALSRPFGRESTILPHAQYSWQVNISVANPEQPPFRYNISIHRPQLPNDDDDDDNENQSNTISVQRSYADCLWLQQALHQEFQGALLVPNLPLLVQQQQQQQQPSLILSKHDVVDSSVLKYWLMDLLNGIRGSGEWILPIVQQPYPSPPTSYDGMIDMIHCESFETFLYCHSIPTLASDHHTQPPSHHLSSSPTTCHRQMNHCTEESTAPGCHTDTPLTFLQSFFNVALSPMEFCVGPAPLATVDHRQRSSSQPRPALPHVKLPVRVINCSSRAIGTASDLNIDNSIADTSSINSGFTSLTPMGSASDVVIHSELILAQKDLALNYVRTSRAAIDKLKVLLEVENQVGAAWKRFIVSINNLFTYEKDVESANIGNMKVKRENMPYRKIEKSVVDECLRVMMRQKLDRSVPGLQILSTMISAYHADVSSVEASVNTYTRAIQQILSGKPTATTTNATATPHGGSTGTTSTDSTSSSPTQQPSTKRTIPQKPLRSWDDLKDWTLRSLQAEPKKMDNGINATENDASKKLLLLNERRFRLSLTTMFRTVPFRISRIAWRYWHTEASHCAMMNSAAAELRTKLDIVNPSSVSKLLKRHSKDEKIDCANEMELIQRIVNLGHGKKFPNTTESITDAGSINNELVEVDNDDISEERTNAIKRDKALDIARRRIGRWNAVLAMAILEAVGVDDPNVRVEETTRDLRLVRKYAIGLRECLNRCVEALLLLKEAVTGQAGKSLHKSAPKLLESNSTDNSTPTRLKTVRSDFQTEMSLLFSGSIVDDPQTKRTTNDKRSSTISKAVLHSAGIDTTDPSGWIPTTASSSTSRVLSKGTAFPHHNDNPVRIGNCAVQYVNTRDAHIEWLLSSLDGLFQEYAQRIEVIEGFVYMECVGIQLEKHFSAKRAKALSAFEKKTDLTTAANMARKKRMPQLLTELQGKLEKLGPAVSHTTVKETKEAHLESKNVKASLHDLAMRRLVRAQETSTERVVTILDLWAKEEEINATEEIKALGEAMALLEKSVCSDD